MPCRIAIVAPHFAEYSERLAAGLAEQAQTVLILNTPNRAESVGRPIQSAARVIEMPMNRRPDQALALLRCLGWAIRSRANVVIVQEGVREFLKPLVRLLRMFTRVALIVHDPAPHSGSDSALAAKHVPYRRWLREHADVLIVHGETCRREMVALGYAEERIVKINHGVLMAPDHKNETPPEPNRVLMFGRMEAYKGLEVLLEAAAILAARNVPFHLVIAGAGPEQARLADRMVALDSVEVIDRYLSPDELERQLARAAVVVAPYLDATQSGVLASTFANGRPAIASDVGGLGDVLQQDVNGLLVPPGDPVALADAMEALLDDPPRIKRLAAGAAAFAATTLNWNQIASELLAALPRIRPRDYWRAAVGAVLALSLAVGGVLAMQAEPGRSIGAGYKAPDCESPATHDRGKPNDPPVADMYGTSEIMPAGLGVLEGKPMTFALHPRIGRGNDPRPGWKSMIPWGQVFISVNGDHSRNTRVEVRNLRLFVRPKATGAWCRLQLTLTPKGAFYLTSFEGDRQLPGDQRVEADGGRSFRADPARAIHFYALRRVPIPDGGVSGVYADFEARLIKDDPKGPDDRRLASLVASAGTDYWISDDAPSGHVLELNEDAAIGRFRRVTARWGVHSMNTAASSAIRRQM